jgi:hypothetical protein
VLRSFPFLAAVRSNTRVHILRFLHGLAAGSAYIRRVGLALVRFLVVTRLNFRFDMRVVFTANYFLVGGDVTARRS